MAAWEGAGAWAFLLLFFYFGLMRIHLDKKIRYLDPKNSPVLGAPRAHLEHQSWGPLPQGTQPVTLSLHSRARSMVSAVGIHRTENLHTLGTSVLVVTRKSSRC